MVRPALMAAAGYTGGRQAGDLITYTIKEPVYDPAELRQALDFFLECSGSLGRQEMYQQDLIDFTKHYLGDVATRLQILALRAYQNQDLASLERHAAAFLELLTELDRLLAARPRFRLSTHLAAARRWGKTRAEKNLYERNLRRLLTTWGGHNLDSYAYKEWSGLLSGFYRERWRMFFERARNALRSRDFFDSAGWNAFIENWEERWIMELKPIREPKAQPVAAMVRKLLAKYRDFPQR